MRQLLLYCTVIVIFTAYMLSAQTAIAPANGDGSISKPYQIKTLENLYWIAADTSRWKYHYIQTADINAGPARSWHNDSGWLPIGNSHSYFSGTYNGKGHIVDSLFFNRPNVEGAGFFGCIGGAACVIESLQVRNIAITGFSGVGGLVGESGSAEIRCSSASGVINGSYNVGGLLGTAGSTNVINCYSEGSVKGINQIGGLVAGSSNSTVSNSYSLCMVNGEQFVGGLIGQNFLATIKFCYSNGLVSGTNYVGGLVGYSKNDSVFSSFWDKESSHQTLSAGGTGKKTAEMKCRSTFTDSAWDFIGEKNNGTTDIWGINSINNNGYPFLKQQGYKIGQTINFDSISAVTYGCDAVTLKASASSELPVIFTSLDTGIARIAGSKVVVVGTGAVVIMAKQAGDTLYFPDSASETLLVNRKILHVKGVTAKSKIYDGTTAVTLTKGVLDSVVSGDTVTLIAGSGKFVNKNVGIARQVIVTDFTLGGVDSALYSLCQPDGFSAEIEAAPLTIRAHDVSKGINAQDPHFTVSYEGFITGEDSTVVNGLVIKRERGDTVGSYAIVPSGATAANYIIQFVNGTLTIEKPVSVSMNKTSAVHAINTGNGIFIHNNPVFCNSGDVHFTVYTGGQSMVHVRIFDANANILNEKSLFSSGKSIDFIWNLRTKNGKPVSGGTYLIVANVEDQQKQSLTIYKEKLGVKGN